MLKPYSDPMVFDHHLNTAGELELHWRKIALGLYEEHHKKDMLKTKKTTPTNPRMKLALSTLKVYLTSFCNQGVMFSHLHLFFLCSPRQEYQ